MKVTRLLLPVFLAGVLFTSCSKEDDTPTVPEVEKDTRDLEVEEFIYSGMNEIYLYKADVAQLKDGYFSTNKEKRDFLDSFDSPSDLYEGIQTPIDDFSFMTNDYIALENSFSGISKTTGMKYLLSYYGDGNDVLGLVQYVMPGTPAETEGVKRGDVFTKINGQSMNDQNYPDLLNSSSLTIDINYIENNKITPTGKEVSLTKIEYTSNPVYITKAFDIDGKKVGYLMYNSFTANFGEELNNAFGDFKGHGITDLVLDLRYNGGGSVSTAVGLAGMITGQFKDKIFLKEQWNEKYQNAWSADSYINRFSDKLILNPGEDNEREIILNSLNLDEVYVLTTKSTASASELIINGLDPYIDVVQIGDKTTGKFQASITLYDSPNFGRDNANPNHTYAIQPLVMKSANVDGVSDYVEGLTPTIEIKEVLSNLGTLGDKEEPLLKAALNDIAGIPQDQEQTAMTKRAAEKFKVIGESGINELNYQRMYIDRIPQSLEREIR